MALEEEINAVYLAIQAGTEGQTIASTIWDPVDKKIVYNLSNGVHIIQRIDDAIISALES